MKKYFLAFIVLCALLSGCGRDVIPAGRADTPPSPPLMSAEMVAEDVSPFPAGADGISLDEIPEYSGTAYAAVNGNVPFFTDSELVTEAFEVYSPLDSLGRCGIAYANICPEIMPTEARGSIGSVKPTGWQLAKYDAVDGNYLYNRCHLIAYQLAGENANEENLITGTRYLNVVGMVPFEDMVADYVNETGNHVLYRVSPLFEGDNLLASGVLMEALSVEDGGDGISFNVFCYNVQPGIAIDYASGESRLADDSSTFAYHPSDQISPNAEATDTPEPTAAPVPTETVAPTVTPAPTKAPEPTATPVPTDTPMPINTPEPTKAPEPTVAPESVPAGTTYVLNTNSMKFHYPDCSSAKRIASHNRKETSMSREECILSGYDPCKNCRP